MESPINPYDIDKKIEHTRILRKEIYPKIWESFKVREIPEELAAKYMNILGNHCTSIKSSDEFDAFLANLNAVNISIVDMDEDRLAHFVKVLENWYTTLDKKYFVEKSINTEGFDRGREVMLHILFAQRGTKKSQLNAKTAENKYELIENFQV